ncbi:MAG: 4-(cytidine 5'-diphospho)-2-C-methyl-D-erythritol kinase [Desulfuromonas sp.]|nr:MAG: 4-(cytidine 5'-diphospho)-2-C-methyl-D-erythritol kinase [Desulfuromonas sp.]
MSVSRSSATVLAHAKVNLCLHVLGRRPDGYHEVAMLMQQVDLADRLQMTVADNGKIRSSCPGLVLADGEENITTRAARLLLDHVGAACGVTIEIDKQIPQAAGLGGGSADAAAVLLGLNRLLDLRLTKEELMKIGLQLGADVPFFLFGAPAWATGIGECLEVCPGIPSCWLVLVNPGEAVSTAWVYQNLRLTGSKPAVKLPKFSEGIGGLVRLLHNDLERVTIGKLPVVAEVKQALVATGARAALMSGSGPTVFGLYPDRGSAADSAQTLSARTDWWVRVVKPLS